MRTIRTITVGLLATAAFIVAPLVGTADASTSSGAAVSDNVVPVAPLDYPWG